MERQFIHWYDSFIITHMWYFAHREHHAFLALSAEMLKAPVTFVPRLLILHDFFQFSVRFSLLIHSVKPKCHKQSSTLRKSFTKIQGNESIHIFERFCEWPVSGSTQINKQCLSLLGLWHRLIFGKMHLKLFIRVRVKTAPHNQSYRLTS